MNTSGAIGGITDSHKPAVPEFPILKALLLSTGTSEEVPLYFSIKCIPLHRKRGELNRHRHLNMMVVAKNARCPGG